tara:strand:+ start:553 stop:717 length:165 start_codon:yes stop_codon:yes gene_type:complete
MTIDEDYPRTRVSERPRTKKEAKDFKKQFKFPWDDVPIAVLLIIVAALIYGTCR